MVEEDHDVIHFDNSYDLPLSTSLNDLDSATLHIDGQSTEVDAPLDIIDLDEDDDISDDEDAIPHDLAYSDDEDLVNVDDDDGVEMLADVARGHGGDGGSDDRPPTHHIPTIYGGCFANRGLGEAEGDDLDKDRALDRYQCGHPTAFAKVVQYQQGFSQGSALGYKPRDPDMESSPTREYPSLIHTFFVTHAVGGVFVRDEDRALYDEMLRLQRLGSNTETGVPYTEEEIMVIVRKGKQRGHLPGVGRVKMMMRLFRSDNKFSQMLDQFESSTEFGGPSESGGCGDDEPGGMRTTTRMGRMRRIAIVRDVIYMGFSHRQVVRKSLKMSLGIVQEEKQVEEEQAANARYWKILACCDDDNDDYNFAITPNEPVDSLSMGDEHLNTISPTKSDEFIKSCVENLVPNPSESEGENGCDVPAYFTTFSNVLFDAEYEFDSSDDQSLYDEDVPKKIFSNPLFEEEIIPMKIDQHHFNVESDLIESLLNHDSSIIPSSSKIDALLDEFAGELKSIPSGIDETDCDPEEDIRIIERLLYDNSSPCLPEEFVSGNSNADIESFSPSPIPVKDSDSFMEEIDLSFTSDDPMPSGIKEDDDDSERDILILEELLDNYSLSLSVIESYHFDIPSSSRPPAKQLDGLEIFHLSATNDDSWKEHSDPGCSSFPFLPPDQFKYGGDWVKPSDLKQALRGRHPMLILS
nr:hypothetical protein [Tanacetum cinerariifolium]